jgi:hypothetical protein
MVLLQVSTNERTPLRLYLDLGGSAVEGTLIDEQTWLTRFVALYGAVISSEPSVHAKIQAIFQPFQDHLSRLEAETAANRGLSPFLHLADVRSTGSSEPLALLRVRTADVRAWTLLP